MNTNQEALLDEIWRICAICADGNIPIEAEISLANLPKMIDNLENGRFITYGLPSALDTD